ncbi:dsDNA nuclease domain-containing protein [Salinicola salarius]|uniref:dsDNA nuclease domain-containing protein n=1 Tax=Salinicola salarius TaxID=430457 RepID=UPI0023E4740E|nr:dsDNA nuclease domain-containing protein [Salinicola salarius]MDF3918653.1 dsDNA nuclease domain-containing protein [Salinicola salarius]
MTSDILTQFSALPPRETAGSSSSNRFDYQKNWSICHFLELHQDGKDYLVVFDHHEDTVVFDHRTTPDSACFYQVKSKKSGSWTIARLAKCKGEDHESSILRKIYSNYECFPEFAVRLAFISNQGISTKDRRSGKKVVVSRLRFDEMHLDEKTICSSALESKHKSYSDLSGLRLFEFERTLLTIEDHVAQTKGKLSEFFENLFPTETINIGLAYKTIFDEVRRKTNFEHAESAGHYPIVNKSLSKDRFNEMLSVMVGQRSNGQRWSDASQILLNEGCNGLALKGIKNAWNQIIIEEMDSGNEQFQEFSKLVRSVVESKTGSGDVTIIALAKEIREELSTTESWLFDVSKIAAMICREVTKDEQLQEVG